MDKSSNNNQKNSFGKEKSVQHTVKFKSEAEVADLNECLLDMKYSNSEDGLLSQTPTESLQSSSESSSGSVRRCLSKYGKLLGSIIARLLFLSHSVACVLVAVSSIHAPYIYLLISPMSLLIAEAYLTLKIRKNVEWKWFTPCIAIYQLCTVPSIWLLEYREFDVRRNASMSASTATATTSIADVIVAVTPSPLGTTPSSAMSTTVGDVMNTTTLNFTNLLYSFLSTQISNSSFTQSTMLDETAATATNSWETLSDVLSTAGTVAANITNSTEGSALFKHTGDSFANFLSGSLTANVSSNATYSALRTAGVNHQIHKCEKTDGISSIPPIGNVSLDKFIEQYCLCSSCIPLLEQILLLFMIIGRWLLPRGEHLSRDQKAQLLLVNIAIAADILELFEMMKEDGVKTNELLITVVLSLWSCSLIQFAIVATATAKKSCRGCACFESEIWSLMTLLFLDDAPFLAFRLVCIIKYHVKSYTSYFFASKNVLVLALDVNRIIALHKENEKQKKQEAESTELHQIGHRRSVGRIRR